MKLKTSVLFVTLFFALAFPSSLALAQDTADQAVRRVIDGIADNRPQVVWEALPPSYQDDISGLVVDLADALEGGLWDRTFLTLRKTVRVLDEKREFILQQPIVAERLAEGSPDSAKAYSGAVTLLSTLVNSDLSEVRRLREIDPGQFLATTGSQMLEQIDSIASLSPDSTSDIAEFKTIRATLIESHGDSAKVELQSKDKTEIVDFVRVEGKWIPKEMADSWKEDIAQKREEFRQQASQVQEEFGPQADGLLTVVDGALDQLLAANSLEEFSSALESVIGMAMLQFATLMPSEGN